MQYHAPHTKADDVAPAPGRLRKKTSRWEPWRLAASALIGLVMISFLLRQLNGFRITDHLAMQQGVPEEAAPTDLKWSDIEPSRKLQWQRCYNNTYDCARIDLPMDWLDPSEDERVVLAVIRLRATATDDYKGPIFFNPGGPGGSGVYALKDHGALLQTIAGRNHDIISFDPRGIGASIPRVDCWGSSEKSRLWALQDVGVVDAHPGTIYDAFARAAAFSQNCERNMKDFGLLPHLSTASHARDMLEILHQTGNDKLRYWGFSYGTVLGGVFAAMYPEKVERLVSDGNVDYREWHLQTHVNFLRDTDKVMAAFYTFCHQAGPSSCAFYADTPAAIEDRLSSLLKHIREHPVVVPAGDSGPDMPQLITWSHLKRLVSAALYRPIFMFKKFAEVLRALEEDDGEPFYALVRAERSTPPICSVKAIPPNVPRLEEGNDEAFPSILCADAPPMTDTVEEFREFVEELKQISSAAGDVNALFRLACVGRTVRPKWRYDGPFEGNTSHPILYVANIADNISPLISARNNSQGFPGSVVLVQNSYGHTTLSASSTCTAGYIQAYFQNGTLPEPGTSCEPDYHPFQEIHSHAEDELATASYELSKVNWGFGPRIIL
ncbi:alpha/beta-hydrolase [Whalleya microplaca]|nr:alpha/beta-hydrolase [Whalleya microplaca]